MKQGFSILVFIFLVSFNLSAGHIDPEKAGKAAAAFLANKTQGMNPVQLLHQENRKGEAVYYIFGGETSGFIILAADDQVFPVLGYSTENTFSMTEIPVQLKSWLDFSADQIVYVQENKLLADAKTKAEWSRLLSDEPAILPHDGQKDVSPLLPCTWDQGKFYNELCPKAAGGDGGHVWVGCVATAMAQVMFYYRYPQTGIGTHTYTHPTYGVQSVNYGNTTYQWNGMLNALNTSNFPVAELSYHCAVSVNMDFGPDGSGANTGSVPGALVNNFGYSSDGFYHQKFFYTPAAWLDLIKSNLDEKHPVMYSGHPGNGEAGHCWVIDGYQGTDYFHCNWGWSGASNGYFYIDALNPAAGGTNFNYGQGAAFDIYPPTASYPAYCTGQTLVTHTTGTIEDGSWVMPYAPSANCSWLIDPADSVNSLKLTFHRFDTEAGNDVLTVYGGATTAAPVLGTFSGSSLPSVINFPGDKMLITFTSNSTVENGGWYLTYSAVLPVYCTGVTATAPSGTIKDGSGPAPYQANTTCTWIIQPPAAAAVKLTFTSFDLEQGNDFLKVYDLGTQTLLANLTGNSLPAEIIANSGSLYLEFKSNSSIQGQGWEANYVTLGVGINDPAFLPELKVYPVPAGNQLSVETGSMSNTAFQCEIYSIEGRCVLSKQAIPAGDGLIQLDVSALESGIYYLRLTGTNGTRSLKISIE